MLLGLYGVPVVVFSINVYSGKLIYLVKYLRDPVISVSPSPNRVMPTR
jgi:hypothetical protein